MCALKLRQLGVNTEIHFMSTAGDRSQGSGHPCRRSAAKGCLPQTWKSALSEREIDLAVHSLNRPADSKRNARLRDCGDPERDRRRTS
jgi:porphobilinogen deaminase